MENDMTIRRNDRISKLDIPKSGVVRRWFQGMIGQSRRPVVAAKPMGLHVPDRVWLRQSAMIMSLYDEQS